MPRINDALRILTIATLALVAAALPARAESSAPVAAPAAATLADSAIEITLSTRLQALEKRIDAIERQREKRFRKNRHYDRNAAVSVRRFAKTHYRDVAWANELLVSDLAAYGVKNLLAALVNESLNRAGIDRTGVTLRVHLDALRVANHSLARLSGAVTYAYGSISLIDTASGQVVRAADISANLVIDPTVDYGYQGPDFVFEDTDPSRRVGPALAYFVMTGLGELYKDAEFPRPVTVIF